MRPAQACCPWTCGVSHSHLPWSLLFGVIHFCVPCDVNLGWRKGPMHRLCPLGSIVGGQRGGQVLRHLGASPLSAKEIHLWNSGKFPLLGSPQPHLEHLSQPLGSLLTVQPPPTSLPVPVPVTTAPASGGRLGSGLTSSKMTSLSY